MALNQIFGIGGYCENCDPSHEHPLHNIIEEVEVPEPEQTALEAAVEKLMLLGLTQEEAYAIATGSSI